MDPMMDRETALARLTRHLTRLDELIATDYVREIFSQQTGVMLSWNVDGGFDSAVVGPSIDKLKSAILDMRLLYSSSGRAQHAEHIDIRSALECLRALDNSGTASSEYEKARQALNEWLDQKSFINFRGQTPSRRDLFDAWFWGKFAHLAETPAEQLRIWLDHPYTADVFENEFRYIFGEFCRFFRWSRPLVVSVIREARGAQTRS
jgi:hypothetical protein